MVESSDARPTAGSKAQEPSPGTRRRNLNPFTRGGCGHRCAMTATWRRMEDSRFRADIESLDRVLTGR